ncbi:Tripartite tricarboxylate transporter TctB family protein [Noviherbaspirillum humi]|uniref:Tripartite tricarboxylate transporter TctB family protein n=1 Tax=Noviherbaspirillum humi TaxID=1688639 RepID=A0A239FHW9_9BURK|nr:tripartite tricarboxylate transporter TctB family protein [Noviherbaspirillum humi]SNS56118.1 Tripartite tricarboxylate transporter TctB family protein [Noviherbaspirillum humi]
MRIKNQKDFWAGIMFLAFGAFFSGFGVTYNIGTAARMGPGYFPTMLGVLLMILGIVVSIGGTSKNAPEEKVAKFDWPILFLILGAVVLFGILLPILGLVVSLVLLVIISSYASHEFKWVAAILNAVVLTIMSYVVFAWALKLQFPLWPSFIAG